MNRFISGLYSLARAAAWFRAFYRAGQGRPQALARRIRNRPAEKLLGRLWRL